MKRFWTWGTLTLVAATLAAGVVGCAASSTETGTSTGAGAKTPASGAPPASTGRTGGQSDTVSTPH